MSLDREFSFAESFMRIEISPSRPDVIVAVNSLDSTTSVSMFSLENHELAKILHLNGSFAHVNSLRWDSSDSLLVADGKGVHVFGTDGTAIASQIIDNCSAACFLGDPSQVIGSSNRSLKLWDIRSGTSNSIHMSNISSISSLDVNPNRAHTIATGCKDGRVLIWDLRRCSPNGEPVQVFDAHNHHVNNVKFNPLRDELILSSSADCSLKVWCCESASSGFMDRVPPLIENQRPPLSPLTNPVVPYRGLSFPDQRTQILTYRDDRLISQIDRHSDTVNDICWSHASPWIFASVSKDGLVMINSVPKYLTR